MSSRQPSPDQDEAARFGLSSEYWARIAPLDREMYRVIRPLRRAGYSVDCAIKNLERCLEDFGKDLGADGSFELVPDFQRGHVWTRAQQVAYVEAVLRGVAPTLFRFNNPSYDRGRAVAEGPDALPCNQMTCVDGLQRITALRSFVAGGFKVFDRWTADDLHGTSFSLARHHVTFEVYSITTRSELLGFYLDLNSGGTVHDDADLERVRALRAEALATAHRPPARRKPR